MASKQNHRREADVQLGRIAAAEADSDAQVRDLHARAGKAHDRLGAKAAGLLRRMRGARDKDERRALAAAYVQCMRERGRYQVCRGVAREMLGGAV